LQKLKYLAHQSPFKSPIHVRRAGITGIIRTQEEKAKETDQNLQAAFSDINALMEKAKEMV
jgi:hypothetical protein